MPRRQLDVLQIAIYFWFSVDHVTTIEDTEMTQMSLWLCWKLSNEPYMCQSSCKQTETVRSSARLQKTGNDVTCGGGELHTRAAAKGKTRSPMVEMVCKVKTSSVGVQWRQTAVATWSSRQRLDGWRRRQTDSGMRNYHIDCYSRSRAAAAIEIYDAAASRGLFARVAEEMLDPSPTTVCGMDSRGCPSVPRTLCPTVSNKLFCLLTPPATAQRSVTAASV